MGGCVRIHGRVPPGEPNRNLFSRQKSAIFGGMATVRPAQPLAERPCAQLDDVHSVLRLSCKTLKGLI
jgi:hypothetical protein